MARAHFVKKAAKDNPAVKKGQPYWWWQFRHGGKHFSATRPKQSQLTQSEFLSQAYELAEEIADWEGESLEDLRDFREDVVNRIRELGEEQEERRMNMPDHLQDAGMAAELLQGRYDAMEEWASNLEDLQLEDEDLEDRIDEEAEDTVVARQEAFDEIVSEFRDLGSYDGE